MSTAATVRHGRSSPDACSVLWDDAEASALGTAPLARFWVALEQNGPWGAQAATQSRLDPDLGRTLDQFCRDASGRFILIRRPGTHSDLPESPLQRVYVAGGLGGRPWLLEADLEDPVRLTRLARLEVGTLRSGDLDAIQDVLPELRRSPVPQLMICANSRRDVCCSVRGRPVALQAALQRPGQVWECSHTGGHRFAPTGVLLPHGQVFGRLTGASAVAAVDAAGVGEVPTELLGSTFDRGRSHLPPAGQAAESMVREQIQEPRLLALSTTVAQRPDQEKPGNSGNSGNTGNSGNSGNTGNSGNSGSTGNTWRCLVRHLDGRTWDVVAVSAPGRAELPESCGKEPVPAWQWSVATDSGR